MKRCGYIRDRPRARGTLRSLRISRVCALCAAARRRLPSLLRTCCNRAIRTSSKSARPGSSASTSTRCGQPCPRTDAPRPPRACALLAHDVALSALGARSSAVCSSRVERAASCRGCTRVASPALRTSHALSDATARTGHAHACGIESSALRVLSGCPGDGPLDYLSISPFFGVIMSMRACLCAADDGRGQLVQRDRATGDVTTCALASPVTARRRCTSRRRATTPSPRSPTRRADESGHGPPHDRRDADERHVLARAHRVHHHLHAARPNGRDKSRDQIRCEHGRSRGLGARLVDGRDGRPAQGGLGDQLVAHGARAGVRRALPPCTACRALPGTFDTPERRRAQCLSRGRSLYRLDSRCQASAARR